jgi:ubiquinone/menaquinone biosynthesis C-methylase UbiE
VIRDGVVDTLGEDTREVITPFQRIMQTPLVVSIYERIWRRIGYFIASSRSFSEELKTVLKMNLGKETSRVLDLACGTGIFTRPLAMQSRGVVVGLDLSPPMLRLARRLVSRAGIRNVLLVRASAFRLPFIDATFSYVNCCGALHLFHKPDQALAEIRRVLAPGGHLCVQTTIRPSHSVGMAHVLERFIRFGFFGEQDLEEMIRRYGFRVVKSERHRISHTFLCR